MDDIRKLVKEVAIYSTLLNVIAAVVAIVWFRPLLPVLCGLLLGLAFGIWNFNALSNAITKSVQLNAGSATTFVSTRYFMRFVLTGVVLAVAVIVPSVFNIYATAFGMLSIRFVIYWINLFNKK